MRRVVPTSSIGTPASKQLVKSGPETLALIDDVLQVRIYNTDYQFRVE